MSVMAMLDAHLEQISLCAASIAELSFPPPKISTNALLQPHHITTLIRDTEVHERALFTVPQPEKSQDAPRAAAAAARNRRTTTFQQTNGGGIGGAAAGFSAPNVMRAPRRNTAVAAALGPDLAARMEKSGGGNVSGAYGYRREKGEVDIEVLLEGAEKLCGVYSVPGASQKLQTYRRRYQELAANIAHYEGRIDAQSEQLGRMNRRDFASGDADGEDDDIAHAAVQQSRSDLPPDLPMTAEEMKREEEEIRELERKKRMLEERVGAMEKDISGVMR